MSKSTKISVEVTFNSNGYAYDICSPAGCGSNLGYDKLPEDRLKSVLKEVEHLLRICETVAAKEALREAEDSD